MKKLFLLLFIIHSSLFTAIAQDQHLVDSLETKLKTLQAEKHELRNDVPSINDSTECNILYDISTEYWVNNFSKATDYAYQCLNLSELIGYKKGVGNAYNSLGCINYLQGNYLPALEFQKKALKAKLETGNKNWIAASYLNIGAIYNKQGNSIEALKNYLAALKIKEELNDKPDIAKCYNNIGINYLSQSNIKEALKYFEAALKIQLDIGNKSEIANTYNNLGNISVEQADYNKALNYYQASLKIYEETENKQYLLGAYANIGTVYMYQGKYPEALKNLFISMKMNEETGDKQMLANTFENIGWIYILQKKYNDATEYLNKDLSLSKEIGSLDNMKGCYFRMVQLDSAQGNFNKALEHYKLYIDYRDSLVNTENTKKTVALQMNYDFNKKQAADSIKSSEEKKVISAELKQEQTKSYALYGGLALMVLVASVFFKQRNKIGKEKKRSDDLLLNILPAEVAEELKATGSAETKQFDNVSVLFSDFVGFTSISEQLTPKELVKEIHLCFTAFDEIIERNGLEKIKTIGDAYLAVCGMPMEDKDHAKNTVKAAIEIMEFINKRMAEGGRFNIRIGINSGPVVAGIVGVKKFAYDIWGDTVNTAARMEQHSVNGKINISGSTYELVKNDFKCEPRGKIDAKNKGEVDMYFVSEQLSVNS